MAAPSRSIASSLPSRPVGVSVYQGQFVSGLIPARDGPGPLRADTHDVATTLRPAASDPIHRVRPPLFGRVLVDHAVASVGLGLLVGLLFPPVAALLGVSPLQAFSPLFRGACLLAGLAVGGAGWVLTYRIVGRRVRLLAGRTAMVAEVLAGATYSGDWSDCAPENCRIPVDSADSFGEAARSFNALLETLVQLHVVQDHLAALSRGMLERSGVGALATWGLERIEQSVSAAAGAVVVIQGGALRTVAAHGLADAAAVAESSLLAAAITAFGPTVVQLPADLPVDRIVASSLPTEVVVVPLRVESVPLGALLLVLDRPSTTSEREFVALQATTLALALHSAGALEALQLLAAQDPLTGLLNRRFGEARLHEEYARAVRGQSPLGLLMLDLDQFKAVNDTYGHLTGDKVLRAMASALGIGLREGDTVARFGGDEFLVLAPGADLGNALELAERVRRAVSEVEVHAGTSVLRVSVSIGVASWPEVPAASAVDLMRVADQALFVAKEDGRNRVVVAAAGGVDPAARLVSLAG